LSTTNDCSLILCWDGRRPALNVPRASSFRMLGLYSLSTRRLSAFGCGFGDSHHTRVNASFTRDRRIVTHSAGVGSRAGL
jgi:hypothetical protein